MNQSAFLRRFDAAAFGAFKAAGVADGAVYIPPGTAEETPCTVLYDQDVQDDSEDEAAPISAPYDRVTLQLAEVTPRTGGRVRIEATGVVLRLVKRLRGDASSQQWEVESG